MKPATELSIIILIAMVIMITGITGLSFGNYYVGIGGIVAMAILILYVKFMPDEEEQVGFPKEII